MRILKFRAWSPLKKHWSNKFDDIFINQDGEVYDDDVRTHDTPNREISKNDRLIISMFTGLLDKNGKEIYEGDILKHYHRGMGRVIYEAPGFRVIGDDFDVWLGLDAKKHICVIGNIYSNPELIKEKEGE